MSENHFEDGLPEEPQHDEPVIGDDPPKARVLFGNRAYDRTKFLAQIVLPAFATFYATLGALWEFPKTDQTVGTIVAVDLFLGALLMISTAQYKSQVSDDDVVDGTMFVRKDSNVLGETVLKTGYLVDTSAEELEKKDKVVFRVKEAPEDLMSS